MSESQETEYKSGRYAIDGRPAFCVVDGKGVQVFYDDRCYTAATHDTFKRWNPVLIEE